MHFLHYIQVNFYFFKISIFFNFFLFKYFFHYTGESYGQSVLTNIPLLHTWSLSLEEQFYLFFPIILFIIYKFREDKINFFLILFFLISLSFAITINPNNSSFNFYMLPSRGWEFILGALLAVNEKKIFLKGILLPSFISFVGLMLIFYSFIALENTNEHPGISTLLPTFGTALIIISSNSKNYINFLLSNIIKKTRVNFVFFIFVAPSIFFFQQNFGIK